MTGGAENMRTMTNTYGNWTFRQVAAGNTYVFEMRHKRDSFSQPTQIFQILENREDLNFIEIS